MSTADVFLGLLWIGLTLYALLGGADFGAGLWDLLAGGARRGRAQRELIEHSIGPVWEANHVWLIFVITLFWTGFPAAFAAFAATLYIPLTLAALGIIARGSAFAFRKVSDQLWQRRLFGAAFASSSVLTPFFLGTVVGALASQRVPPGLFAELIGQAWPFVLGSILAGITSLVLLVARKFVLVRITAALGITAVLWGWGAAQYPMMLPGLTIDEAATDPAVLRAALWALGVGGLILVPSLLYLFAIFQSNRFAPADRNRRR